MGRRAKNKQSDPAPLADASQNKPSAKKLGKRKADAENDERETLSKRPAKKARESEDKKVAKKGSEGELKKKKSVKFEEKAQKKGKTKVVQKEVADEDAGEGSEGWEDVEDDYDLKTEAKYVGDRNTPPYLRLR